MASRKSTPSSDPATKILAAIGVGAMVVAGSRLLLDLFGPSLPYSMSASAFALDAEEFVQFLSVITDGTLRRSNITRLKNGNQFYPAELEAIRRAKHAINLEFYEFEEGRITDEFLSALAERAAAGVEVRLIVDAIGSNSTRSSYFDGLRKAGGQMRWYHPIRWNTWPMVNNRTHRKILIIDGETGFMGGAGVADHWIHATPKEPVWRDSVFCVEGEAVAGLISTFSENWLESSGEILCGAAQFAFRSLPEGKEGFVVSSTPHGGGTQARILFQALIKSARKSIRITTPYFLPDRSARQALIEAVRSRGVEVQILTAGPRIDHPLIRKLTHRSVHHLLQAGAKIYEYQPSMIHAKTMTVDQKWSVIGSTNFDHRSFALNDEVNLATLDPALAEVLDADLTEDLKQSRELTLSMLRERTLVGQAESLAGEAIQSES